MLSVFGYAFNAVAPIILVMILGFLLKKTGFLTDEFLSVGNKLMFRICLPAMLFLNIYDIKSISDINWSLVLFSFIAILVLFFIGFLCVLAFVPDRRQKGVVLQCSFRSNFAIIGIPLAMGLGGESAVSVVGVLMLFAIAVFNVLAVLSLAVFTGERFCVKTVLKEIIGNPLILSIAVAALFKIISVNLGFSLEENLPFVYKSLGYLSDLASPLALIVLGGQFTFGESRAMAKPIILGTVLRTVIAPFLALGSAVWLTKADILCIGTTEFPALVSLFASPVAVSSAVMASEMKNDGALASQLVLWTSLASVVTVFLFTVFLRTLGMM